MKVKVNTLKKYIDIVGIGQSGDFEAKTVDGNLFASIGGNGGTALVKASLPCDENIMLRANAYNIKSKYLDNFTDEVEMVTSDDVITLTDGKLTLTLAQLTEEAAARNTRSLTKELPPFVIEFDVDVDDLKRIKRVADSHKEYFIKIDIDGDDVKFIIKNKATLLPSVDVTYNEYKEVYSSVFHIMMIDDILSHAVGNVTLQFVENKTYPVTFSFKSIDGIEVDGFIMPSTED